MRSRDLLGPLGFGAVAVLCRATLPAVVAVIGGTALVAIFAGSAAVFAGAAAVVLLVAARRRRRAGSPAKPPEVGL
jgi:hypothetical protein